MGINSDMIISVALGKFSSSLAKHMGRVNREPIIGAEIYVISNRDTTSMHVLDKWLEFIDTREVMPLFEKQEQPYKLADVKEVDWTKEPEYLQRIARDGDLTVLGHVLESSTVSVSPDIPAAKRNRRRKGGGRGERGNGRDNGRAGPRQEALASFSNADNNGRRPITEPQHVDSFQPSRDSNKQSGQSPECHQLATTISPESKA
ncbi:hypothetical protein XPA_005396 [Xanthoria parietina]